ncbi:MAG: insulinase family protein [Gammaproteobacteria bacterium]|nr:insulinase family protein [Gammaproteobacteria bacterium]MBU1416328.1 insulinase family protein [Gammaproteobacteria bacterium]
MRNMRLLLAALVMALSFAAQAGVKIEHWVAPSGARVYFIESHDLPILDVEVDFPAGSAYDPAGKAGLAGLTAGLLEDGAGDLDEEAISSRLVDIGAMLNGQAGDDRAGVTLRTLAYPKERDAALALLQLILGKPTFPEAVVAREKTRSIAAIQEADTRPDAIAAKRFAAAIYPDHPYGISATTDSVERIGRDDLVAFHRDHYAAPTAVVSIIGDVTRGEAEAIAQSLTAALPAGQPEAPLPEVKLPKAETIKVAHPAAQSHIAIGLPAVRRGDPDYFALLVGNYTLGGGGFVSRLTKEVREKRGFAYSVYSYFAPRKLEGPFQIGLQTRRDQAGAALKVADDVLARFIKEGPTAAELAAAKQNLINGLGLRIDSNAKLLGYLSTIGFFGLPLTYLDDFPARVEAVTARQVREAFARHVKSENLVTVIVAGD